MSDSLQCLQYQYLQCHTRVNEISFIDRCQQFKIKQNVILLSRDKIVKSHKYIHEYKVISIKNNELLPNAFSLSHFLLLRLIGLINNVIQVMKET